MMCDICIYAHVYTHFLLDSLVFSFTLHFGGRPWSCLFLNAWEGRAVAGGFGP